MIAPMKFKVMTPTALACEGDAVTISVPTVSGWWTFLPRHRDMVTIVVPGVLTWKGTDNVVIKVAIDEGILTKRKGSITVASRHAAVGTTIEELHRIIADQFAKENEKEKRMHSVIALLEGDFLRRFVGPFS